LSLGFTWFEDDCPLPLCAVCGNMLPNQSVAPSKLKQHFTTKHAHLEGKEWNCFKRLVELHKTNELFGKEGKSV
jgi:hypothetical protein